MADELLPRLRMDLDFMPSPLPERPGLMIRDPFRYSDATLIVPPQLVPCLQLFDGERTVLELRAALVQLTGDLRVGELMDHLRGSLSQAGFFDDEIFAQLKERQQAAFAQAPLREPAHAGAAYPDQPEALRSTLTDYLDGGGTAARRDRLIGIAAPHVSPEGGRRSYRSAYAALDGEYHDRIFVVLGTSHYGEPERFGLTRKPFVTPLGEARTEAALVDELAREAGAAVKMEDYCHAVEHSIEFQVVFLQQLYGPDIRILPVLCGAFAHSIYLGGAPEANENVQRFLGALGELAAREGRRLFWVLGVDMAHMGRRYGDPFAARADEGQMQAVAAMDRQRIEAICGGKAEEFWAAVQEQRDPLKWCGSSPFYTFLRAAPQARAELLGYEQWNIDEQSVVSFGALAFVQ